MTVHLYEIANGYRNIKDIVLNDELTSEEQREAIFKHLDSIEEQFSKKAESIQVMLLEDEASIEAIKREEERLYKKRKAIQYGIEKYKEYIKHNMKVVGLEKLETDKFKFSIIKTQGSLKITDETKIPKEYLNEVVKVEVNKKDLKDAIKNGLEVDGAYIEVSDSLRVK